MLLSVGFDSVSSFTGLFKRRTGLTPAVWQAEKLRVKDEIADRPLRFIPGCFAEKYRWKKDSNFGEVKTIDAVEWLGE